MCQKWVRQKYLQWSPRSPGRTRETVSEIKGEVTETPEARLWKPEERKSGPALGEGDIEDDKQLNVWDRGGLGSTLISGDLLTACEEHTEWVTVSISIAA